MLGNSSDLMSSDVEKKLSQHFGFIISESNNFELLKKRTFYSFSVSPFCVQENASENS